MPGSGKEEFVQVAKTQGLNIIRMGDVVRDEVKRRNLELTDQNVGQIADSERKAHGFGIWAQRTLPYIKGDTVLIDGIRGDAEIEVFKAALKGDFILVGIQSSKEVRFERIKKRARHDAPVSWEEFRERDQREIGWGIENAMAQSEHIIVNEGTLEEFQNKVRDFIKNVKEN
jgi:dephospho-CoA kinase